MSYSELLTTDTLSAGLPTKYNENFRKRGFLNVQAVSADLTAWTDDASGVPVDLYLVTTSTGTVTVSLPDVTDTAGDAYAGRVITIMKVDAAVGTAAIDPDGSQTINGSSVSIAITTQYNYKTLVSDGVEWFTIGSS